MQNTVSDMIGVGMPTTFSRRKLIFCVILYKLTGNVVGSGVVDGRIGGLLVPGGGVVVLGGCVVVLGGCVVVLGGCAVVLGGCVVVLGSCVVVLKSGAAEDVVGDIETVEMDGSIGGMHKSSRLLQLWQAGSNVVLLHAALPFVIKYEHCSITNCASHTSLSFVVKQMGIMVEQKSRLVSPRNWALGSTHGNRTSELEQTSLNKGTLRSEH